MTRHVVGPVAEVPPATPSPPPAPAPAAEAPPRPAPPRAELRLATEMRGTFELLAPYARRVGASLEVTVQLMNSLPELPRAGSVLLTADVPGHGIVSVPAGATPAPSGALPPGEPFELRQGRLLTILVPAATRFRPDLVLVSAGFDAHRKDPLGGMLLTEEGFADLCAAVKAIADAHAQGRLVLVLEGGYDLDGLADSVHACIDVMAGAAAPGAGASA